MTTIHQPRLPTGPQYAGLRLTADEYFDLPDDGQRYELVNGVVIMSPSPSFSHQRIGTDILIQLGQFLQTCPVGQAVYELDVDLGRAPDGGAIVYRPDVVFFCSEKLDRMGDRVRGIVPDLVVEVVSPFYRRYDLETKKTDYERAGVLEYWVIDPDQREFHFWQIVNGRYCPMLPKDQSLLSVAVPGFRLDLGRVLAIVP